MPLCDIFVSLGQDHLGQLLRHISLGRLRTYEMFDRVKTRLHLAKLNQENLRKVTPKVWTRLGEGDEDLAVELSQAVLISHMDMIAAVLDHLGVPHRDGFFEKDAEVQKYLTEGWQQRAFDACRAQFPEPVLIFYLNHLAHEVGPGLTIFAPGQPG
jgi:hypothetical protein